MPAGEGFLFGKFYCGGLGQTKEKMSPCHPGNKGSRIYPINQMEYGKKHMIRTMGFRLVATLATLGLLVAGQTARADYSYTYSDSYGNLVTGSFTTTSLTSGIYAGLELVTGGTAIIANQGQVASYAGTYNLLPGGPGKVVFDVYYYDNLFFPQNNASSTFDPNQSDVVGNAWFDNWGMMFQKGTTYVNLFGSHDLANNYGIWINQNNSWVYTIQDTGTMTVTPEPSGVLLLGLGLACIPGLSRYRRRFRIAGIKA